MKPKKIDSWLVARSSSYLVLGNCSVANVLFLLPNMWHLPLVQHFRPQQFQKLYRCSFKKSQVNRSVYVEWLNIIALFSLVMYHQFQILFKCLYCIALSFQHWNSSVSTVFTSKLPSYGSNVDCRFDLRMTGNRLHINTWMSVFNLYQGFCCCSVMIISFFIMHSLTVNCAFLQLKRSHQ